MKKTNYASLLAFVAIVTLLVSCKKDSTDVPATTISPLGVDADYSGTINQQRIELAKGLIQTYAAHPETQTQTIAACNQKFDGDRNVLCSSLFAQSVSATIGNQSLKTETTFGDLLNTFVSNESSVANKTASAFAAAIVNSDSLVQIYLFVATANDSNTFEGIVIRPERLEEINPVDLLVINKDGSESTIRSDVDPTKNYLVISRNERSMYSNGAANLNVGYTYKTDALSYLKIKSAKFASVDALRKVEGWWDGDAEVRLDLLYATAGVANDCAFRYTGNWLGGNWIKQTVVWNMCSVTIPTWNSVTQGARKFVWNEEDGATSAAVYSFTYTDPTTNAVLTLQKTVSATTGDVLIGSTYKEFTDPLGYTDMALFAFEIRNQ